MLTVCFDALGTCFTLDEVVKAVDKLYGDQLRDKGWGAKGFTNDWFHSAQRDFTYLSVISAPPPPIAKILKSTLPYTLAAALRINPPSTDDLEPITSLLSSLTPTPGLEQALPLFKAAGATNIILTNGAEETTRGYCQQAGVLDDVDRIMSCDDIGYAKPHKEVYEAGLKACEEYEGSLNAGKKGERWFVAAHLWDLVAAKKAGFNTALLLPDLPPEAVKNDKSTLDGWYTAFGSRPDIVASTILDVAKAVTERYRATPGAGPSARADRAEEEPGPRLTGEEGQLPPDRATMLLI
ncbi:haloacid dehalogenase, type II [Kwoniella sp. DSM 27419]